MITVGSNCAITAGVKIFTHGGARVARIKYPRFDTFGKVKIGDYVYIGTNSLIMPGVTIGDGSLIAAGSVVTKSVNIRSANAAIGNPAKYLCTVDEYIEHNKQFNFDTKGVEYNQKRTLLLSSPDEKFVRKKELQIEKGIRRQGYN